MKGQPGFFDLAERHDKLTQMRDPLVVLKSAVNWEAFRADLAKIHDKARKSAAGAKPWDPVLMFKILILQQTYNLSDEQIEYQIRDRLSFMRFLGLRMEDRVPDEKTVWLFREHLAEHKLAEKLFARFHQQLAEQGFVARGGQMIDATFVEAPRQRNSREENALIKENALPIEWGKPENKHKLAQKDVCARWAKKGNETHYGFKNHVNVDDEHKLVQSYVVTDAAVHDSQVFDELLDHTLDDNGDKRPVYADSAYRSKEQEEKLAQEKIASQICEKGARNHPLTDEQKAENKDKSKTRVRVEHVFGTQAQMGGHIVRTIGRVRAAVKIGLMNLAYNMKRLGQLLKYGAKSVSSYPKPDGRRGAPVAT